MDNFLRMKSHHWIILKIDKTLTPPCTLLYLIFFSSGDNQDPKLVTFKIEFLTSSPLLPSMFLLHLSHLRKWCHHPHSCSSQNSLFYSHTSQPTPQQILLTLPARSNWNSTFLITSTILVQDTSSFHLNHEIAS